MLTTTTDSWEVDRIMVRKRGAARRQPADWIVQVSPNQLVAYNLAQARLNKGWTQEQAAAALEPFLGVHWSKASFSAAERSVDGERIRQFTADEIVAFARCFELPVTWFFSHHRLGCQKAFPSTSPSPTNPSGASRPPSWSMLSTATAPPQASWTSESRTSSTTSRMTA